MNLGVFLLFTVAIITENGSGQIINLEYWMKNLPEQLKNMPFIYLAIPGSHDSMTYGINRSSGLAPDAEPVLHQLFPLFRSAILRWKITQGNDTMQQLLYGIRYLDLRLATKHGTDNFYFTHGLYAEEISGALNQVKSFVESHPGEVVILDFQHFYGFQPDDHQRLIRFLLDLYGSRLVPRQMDLERITLNSLDRLRQQIVIVYRPQGVSPHQAEFATEAFWQPQMMPSPWPQQEKVEDLLYFLTNVRRDPGMGFVHQAVLTPTLQFVLSRWTSSLQDKCAVPVKDEVLQKISKDFEPGPPLAQTAAPRAPVNVVIADFVEMEDAIFPKTIIQLNSKLLRNTEQVYHNYV